MKRTDQTSGHLITAATGVPLGTYTCASCDAVVKASKDDRYCPFCAEPAPDDFKTSSKQAISAEVNTDHAILVCAGCTNVIHTDYPAAKAEDVANTIFCPVCASEDVDVATEEDLDAEDGEELDDTGTDTDTDTDTELDATDDGDADDVGGDSDPREDGDSDELDTDDAELDATDDSSDVDVDVDADNGAVNEDEDSTEDAVDGMEDVDDDEGEAVEQKITSEDLVNDMEAQLIAGSTDNPIWYLFHKGTPIFRIEASTQPQEVRGTLFKQPRFVDFFKQRIRETTVAQAMKEFGAQMVEPQKLMAALDVESLAYERLQGTVLPQFTDCLDMAIQGMVRNVYPELQIELKASFYDEMTARGIQNPEQAIDAAFSTCGTKVFQGLVAKALELFNKPTNVREELKATIMATAGVKSAVTATAEQTDLQEFRSKLAASSVPVANPEPLTTVQPVAAALHTGVVDNVRSKIAFRKRG